MITENEIAVGGTVETLNFGKVTVLKYDGVNDIYSLIHQNTTIELHKGVFEDQVIPILFEDNLKSFSDEVVAANNPDFDRGNYVYIVGVKSVSFLKPHMYFIYKNVRYRIEKGPNKQGNIFVFQCFKVPK